MTIPDYQTLMRPLLELLLEHGEMPLRDAREELAKRLGISDAELAEKIPSGYTTRWMSRVHWSKTYLGKAGALDSPRRGVIRANERTQQLVDSAGPINNSVLMAYPEFQAWLTHSAGATTGGPAADGPKPTEAVIEKLTPYERLEEAFDELRSETLDALLARVKAMEPTDFEKLVVQLISRLGYGGPFGSAEHLGHTGDGGVDGLIKEDRLGLDRVYLQAKRWSTSVGSPEIQGFVGSLVGQQADRGIFITTSSFSAPAREYVKNIAHRVVLVDGRALVELMWDTNLGLSTQQNYELKTIDTDFFDSDLE